MALRLSEGWAMTVLATSGTSETAVRIGTLEGHHDRPRGRGAGMAFDGPHVAGDPLIPLSVSLDYIRYNETARDLNENASGCRGTCTAWRQRSLRDDHEARGHLRARLSLPRLLKPGGQPARESA